MPGENCSIVKCGTSRRNSGVGIFQIPNEKKHPEWRKAWLGEILKTREPTSDFKAMIAENNVYACEKHFRADEIVFCK